eukprot:gb/GEZN01003635.1/.p1 GENE.gb/GEZN01003635.1/~~gb/GEZN01003635.1/.p1  ORF type:complete len:621 (+),score=128.77 gb/GEZN01003635.1/:26-1864(+)
MLRLLFCGVGLALAQDDSVVQTEDQRRQGSAEALETGDGDLDDATKAQLDKLISVSIDLGGRGHLEGGESGDEEQPYVATYDATNIAKEWQRMGVIFDTEIEHKMKSPDAEVAKFVLPNTPIRPQQPKPDTTTTTNNNNQQEAASTTTTTTTQQQQQQQQQPATTATAPTPDAPSSAADSKQVASLVEEPNANEQAELLKKSKAALVDSTFQELTPSNVMHFVHHHQPFMMLFLCDCWRDYSLTAALREMELAMTVSHSLTQLTRIWVNPVTTARFSLHTVYQLNHKVVTEFGASTTKSALRHVTFGLVLETVPSSVDVQLINECCGDKFSLKVGEITNTGFELTITRDDEGHDEWGQYLQIEWQISPPAYTLPLLVIDNIPIGSNNEKFIFRSWRWKNKADTLGNQMALFGQGFLNKLSEPELLVRSQPSWISPAPEYSKGKVYDLVGSTFEHYVMDESKDVLLMIYSPQCGASMAVMQLFEQAAKQLEEDENVIVARIDRTKNDLPVRGIPVFYYPSVYLLRAGKDKIARKLDFSDYNGSKELHDKTKPHSHFSLELITKFVREHGETYNQYLAPPISSAKTSITVTKVIEEANTPPPNKPAEEQTAHLA